MCPPLERADAPLLCIAERPNQVELQARMPLVGAPGVEFDRALRATGLSRDHVSLTSAILCATPMELKRIAREVKAPLVHPVEACRPRLLAEVDRSKALLVMGAVAWSSLTQAPIEEVPGADEGDGEDEGKESVRGESGMMRSRGFPLTLLGKPSVATVNAAYVLRWRRWTPIFRGDVAKAVRHAQGKLSWQPPKMIYFPSPAELRRLLEQWDREGKLVAFDVETRPADGCAFDACTDVLRCVGIGTRDVLTCVPYESVEEKDKQYYTPAEREEIDDILLEWFAKEGYAGAHNRQYDLTVLERHRWLGQRRWALRRYVLDSILLHHVAWSELKHDLGFCVSQYTDAPKHKDVNHAAWKSDRELHTYCMFDVGHTSYLIPTLRADERVQAQARAVVADHELSTVCQRMHEIGIQVDLGEQARHYRLLTHEMDAYREKSRAFAIQAVESEKGATRVQHRLAEHFNPGSMDQLRALLFDVFGVKPVPEKAKGLTPSGEPSVDKAALFYLMDVGLPPVLENLLLAVIDYRESQKLRGTYCDVPPGYDGRVHPHWNPHVVVSGRLSCSGPNMQNLPGPMKTIYCAASDHIFLQWDKSQLEARIAAILSGTDWQIALHLAGGDLHTETTRAILRIAADQPVNKQQRKFGKTFRFAAQYLAGIATIWRMIRNYRDDATGERPYRRYTQTEARANHELFWQKHERLMAWHEENRRFFDKNHYLESAIHQRRRYFLDALSSDEAKEDLANFLIQTAASDDVNEATVRVVQKYPWGFAGPNTGLVNQTHDSLLLEIPLGRVEEIGRDVQNIMYSELRGMPLPVDLAVGRSWGKLKELKA
jgi:DNA polymerase I-like protein with 3'-5' exonuclease and polymerase domains/uracil-DNA glycosylase